jgi:aspartyl-tRNA(Asn)/glutamyl-tRNA(Gln) amidotransferase subunit A
MTAAEGGALHLPKLRTQALEYDPQVRDRLLAGATIPFAAYRDAERFRAWFLAEVLALFEQYDILVAPATPCAAPLIEDPFMEIAGKRVPARSHLGFFTQPLSFIGLPVLAVPLKDSTPMPLGLQLVAAPGGEAKLFAFARQLEAMGIAGAPRCRLAEESKVA